MPSFSWRIFMTPPSMLIVCICTSRALGELAETSLSAVLPLLVIFMKPPPTTWVAAVSRVQGWLIAIFPAAKPWARRGGAAKASKAGKAKVRGGRVMSEFPFQS